MIISGRPRQGAKWLQWGRGLSTAEISAIFRTAFPTEFRASMGPRSFNRGNWQCAIVVHSSSGPLQWGRGLSTAEIRHAQVQSPYWSLLQWGRGLSTAEISFDFSDFTTTFKLQWGRGLSTAEIAALEA